MQPYTVYGNLTKLVT